MFGTVIITCEHGGNEVPEEYVNLFGGHFEILKSHRGWDPGALNIAEFLAEKSNVTLVSCEVTRLLIEMNRSLDNPQLFSEFSANLQEDKKLELIEEFYNPYRNAVTHEIIESRKPVLHLSIHSFTPIWNNLERDVDIGILFDPDRQSELTFSYSFHKYLELLLPNYRIKLNEPYKGIDDGFTTYLRSKFADDEYAGIEIEVNQKFISDSRLFQIQSALLEALKKC